MANEISSISQEGHSEINLTLKNKTELSSTQNNTSSEISSVMKAVKSTIETVFDEKASEIHTNIVSEPSEISVSVLESSPIFVEVGQSSEIHTQVIDSPTSIDVKIEREATPIQVVNEFNSPVLSVRIRGDEKGPQTGDVVLTPDYIPRFHTETFYEKDDLVIYDYRLYASKRDFVSGASFNINDWIPIATELEIISSDHSVDVSRDRNVVDVSVTRIVNEEKVRAQEVERILRSLIDELGLKIKQSDWNVQDSEDEAYIKNKPTKLSQFQNDENFVKRTQVYTKTDMLNQPTVITLEDDTTKIYDILTLNN